MNIVRTGIACLIAVQAFAFHTTETLVKPSDGLKSPAGVAISSDGTIYVADSGNHQVKAVGVDGFVTTLSGFGKPGALDGVGTAAELHAPSGLALDDATQSLYIADTGNHLIRRLDLSTRAITTIAGTGRPGFTDGSAVRAQLHEPTGLTLHHGVLYIADTRNHAIRALDLGNGTITTISGNGTPGLADGTNGLLKTPSATATDDHFLYIADTGNHSIRRLDLTTGELTTIAGTTQPGYLDGPGLSALLNDPQGIAIEGGALYIADTGNHVIRAINLLDNAVTTVAGTGQLAYQDGPTSTAQFKQPAGIIALGALFIADTGNDAIRALWQTPTIASISPTQGTPEGGMTARISGTGFVPGRTTVVFAGLGGAVTWLDAQTLSVIVPAGPVGTADVTITTPGGTSTLSGGWTWMPPFVRIEVRPGMAEIDPGQSIQLSAWGIRSDGTEEEISELVTWSTSNDLVANVDRGLVNAVETGIALIAAGYQFLEGTSTITVRSPEPLPPDPATTAPPTDPTATRSFADSIEFLYSGTHPTQLEVSPGAIDPLRAGILRGNIVRSDGSALSGVTVSVDNHPKYGYTLTRVDGFYDLVVNGAETLTLRYKKDGYVPVQRRVTSKWRDFVVADTVVLTPYDQRVSSVNLSSGDVQVAQGSTATDAHGSRKATLLFIPGTEATMTLPDGTSQTLQSLQVRATELTVGESGPKAMPALLPSLSAYTYCVELSVDEAVAAGATEVLFTKNVWLYVENFLEFPVGTTVPVGYFDRQKQSWISSENGRVIEITSVADGLALVDISGDGFPESDLELQSLGFTPEELATLAQQYAVGQSLWRSPISHFTPWDCNWPYALANGAYPPQNKPGEPSQQTLNPNCVSGSIIECENQVLRETIPLAGGLSLHYRSERAKGFRPSTTVDIQLSDERAPHSTLKRIELKIAAGGRLTGRTFAPGSNQTSTFTWNGTNVYGQEQNQKTLANVRIGYVYQAVYTTPTLFGEAFAQAGGAPLTSSRERLEITLWQEYDVDLTPPVIPDAAQLGGWTLPFHHTFDGSTNTILFGNGSRHSVDGLGATIELYAGLGHALTDGTDRKSFKFGVVREMEVHPNGDLYVLDAGGWDSSYNSARITRKLYRIHKTGAVVTVAGNGSHSSVALEGPATEIALTSPWDFAIASDSTIYLADGNRIASIKDGYLRNIAGTGTASWDRPVGSELDGVLALEAEISPTLIAVTPEGEIFFSDGGYYYLIDAARRLRFQFRFVRSVEDMKFGPDGALHWTYSYSDSTGPKHVISDSFHFFAGINLSAGSGTHEAGSGIDGTAARFGRMRGFDVDAAGNIYVAAVDYNATDPQRVGGGVALLSSDWKRYWIAGAGQQAIAAGDDGLALAAGLRRPEKVAVGPQGEIYFTDWYGADFPGISAIRRIQPYRASGIGIDQVLIPSPDGQHAFVFDSSGRHLLTKDALTGALLWTFQYSGDGALLSATDRDGNVVTIERTNGVASAISASGYRTVLTMDGNGNLTRVEGPDSSSYEMAYDQGLLKTFKNPNGATTTFSYTATGLLHSESDATQATKIVSREGTAKDFSVSLESALGRTREYAVTMNADGSIARAVKDPSGLTTTTNRSHDGTTTRVLPDGTTVVSKEAPDPRWALGAPFSSETLISTPGELELRATHERSIDLANDQEPLSMSRQTDIITLNGRTWTSNWTAADRKMRSSSPLGRSIEQFLDDSGRVTEVRVPEVTPSTMSYDGRGRISSVSQGLRTYTFAWNATDELVSVSDPLARSVRFGYDAAGRVTTQTLPDNRVIGFTYDANGNVTSITPPGRPAHMFTYNAVDLQTSYIAPAVDGLASTTTRYEYNLDKDLTTVTRPDGVTIDLSYDDGGRLSLLNAGAHAYRFGYDSAGRLSSTGIDTAVDLTYAWDGFIPMSISWSGEVSGTVSWTYDNDFRIASETAAGTTVSYAYDNDSLLTKAGDLTLSRDPQTGRLTGTTLGTITDRYEYDDLGQLAVYSASAGGGEIFRVEYARDAIGRITTKTETRYGVTFTESYGYDLAGRLTSVSHNGAVIDTYEYDANGNRTRHDRWADGAMTVSTLATYDSQDRLLSYGDASYTHTPNGELLTKTDPAGTTTYTYDALGNLRRVDMPNGTVIAYVIDGQNRRVGRKVNGVLERGWLYGDQLNPIAELGADGNVISRFVYGSRLNVPDSLIRGGVTYRIVSDHLGSVRYVLDSSTGAITQSLDYDAWGNVLAHAEPGFQSLAFAGGLYDNITGLTRFGARDYAPKTGRWTAKDPVGFAGGDLNIYAYALSQSVNLNDPSGLDVWIEGPSGTEPAGHISIAVGDPNGVYSAYSFGVNNEGFLEGEVYVDRNPSGRFLPGYYRKTSIAEDIAIQAALQELVGKKRAYRPWRTCRNFTFSIWEQIEEQNLGVPANPPFRIPARQVGPFRPAFPSTTLATDVGNPASSATARGTNASGSSQ